jgi:hypothetical protein
MQFCFFPCNDETEYNFIQYFPPSHHQTYFPQMPSFSTIIFMEKIICKIKINLA